MGQFLAPEIRNKSVFVQEFFQGLWPIEKEKNYLNMIWIMYEFNKNKKNPFEQKFANF